MDCREFSVGTATDYEMDAPGIESRWRGAIFHIRLDRPWSSPSLMYNAYWVIPRDRAAGAWP